MPYRPGYLSNREERRFVSRRKKKQLFGDRGPMNTNDPIIDVIEAHRRAYVDTRSAYNRQSAIEDELGAGVRVPAGEAENDPRWIAANDAATKALAVQDGLAVQLLETQPTTIAGAAALLTYYVDVIATTQAEVIFPDLDVNSHLFESTTDEPKRDFGHLIVRNVAAALSTWLLGSEAIDSPAATSAARSRMD
jgi:hypothetical protein